MEDDTDQSDQDVPEYDGEPPERSDVTFEGLAPMQVALLVNAAQDKLNSALQAYSMGLAREQDVQMAADTLETVATTPREEVKRAVWREASAVVGEMFEEAPELAEEVPAEREDAERDYEDTMIAKGFSITFNDGVLRIETPEGAKEVHVPQPGPQQMMGMMGAPIHFPDSDGDPTDPGFQ